MEVEPKKLRTTLLSRAYQGRIALLALTFLTLSCGPVKMPTPVQTPIQVPAPNDIPCTAQDKRFEQVRILISKEQFASALDMASKLAESPCSQDRYPKALALIADIFRAEGKPVNAFHFYIQAAAHAGPPKEFTQNISRAVSSILHMDGDDIIFLVENTARPQIKKELLFKFGTAKAQSGEIQDAVHLLKAFVNAFPKAAYTATARSIISDLTQNSAVHPDKIGILLPLTGYYQAGGRRALSAIQSAVDTHEGNRDFQLIIQDTASDPDTAVDAVHALRTQAVSCIIGPMVTASQAAAQAQKFGIPIILLTQKPGIPRISPFVFRHFIYPEQQIRTGIQYIQKAYGLTNFAILFPDDNYGHTFAQAFKKLVPELGGNITDGASYGPEQTDFSHQIQGLIKGYQTMDKSGRFKDVPAHTPKQKNKIYRAKTDFEVLFIPDGPDAAAMIAPQLKYHGINSVILLGTNLWHSDKLLSAAPYLQKALFTDGFNPNKEKAKAFITRFKEKTGHAPGYIEAAAHDAVSAVMMILENSWLRSRNQMADRVSRLNMPHTLTCPIIFDARGEPLSRLNLYEIKGKEINLIRPCDSD